MIMNFDGLKYRLSNFQLGVSFIHNSVFEARVNEYKEKYRGKVYNTNIKQRLDYSFISLCRDKVVEEYLYSGKYTFYRIGVLINPFRFAPKSAVLLFYHPDPVRVELRVMSGKGNSIYTDDISPKDYHRISITGLENGKNEIVLSLYDKDGNYLMTRSVYITLNNINDEEDNMVVKSELKMQSAYQRIFVTGGNMDPFVINSNGSLFHVNHLADMKTAYYGVYPFEPGRFLWPVRKVNAPSFANPHSALFYEMDFMGRIYKTYHLKKGIHHFVQMMPNGNLVTFSNSMEAYGGIIKEGHMEDIIVEIDRNTGKTVRTVYLKDVFGTRFADMVDWVHGNSLEYNEEEDTMLICMRNIHTFAKIRWSTGELLWFFSIPEMWKGTEIEDKLLKPVGDVKYNYQAHAAYEITDFRGNNNGIRFYLVYDNHRLNRRPVDGHEEDKHSYINIYAVNEKEMTIRQVKNLKVDMSIVRSNARYDAASNHLFNMAGCGWREIEGYRGKLEEYDYDTEKILNRWYIKDDFFSAYQFEWRSDDYCKPLGAIEGACFECGEADEMVPLTDTFNGLDMNALMSFNSVEELEKVDGLNFKRPFLEEGYLYFFTKDHTIDALILKGENHNYMHDYTDTWQAEEKHEAQKYHCVLSIKNVEPDRYDILILIKGKLFNTGCYLKI